jgi:hypothetical protein
VYHAVLVAHSRSPVHTACALLSMPSQVCQVTYTRRLAIASGDTELDQAIVPGDMSVLWSFNTNAPDMQHAFSNRGET